MRIVRTKKKRLGVSAVEFAVVAPVVLMLLFGILEYCRYLMTLQVTDNAVREGARYALARTDTLQTNLTTAGIEQYVSNYVESCGMQLSNTNYLVYKCNQYGQPLDINDNIVASPNQAATFDETTFGDYICVQVTGNYQPVVPGLTLMSANVPVTSTAIMCSEGN